MAVVTLQGGFDVGNANALSVTSLTTAPADTPTARALLVLVAYSKISAGVPAVPTITSTYAGQAGWTQYATLQYNDGSGANDTRLTVFYSRCGMSPGSGTAKADWSGVTQAVADIDLFAAIDAGDAPRQNVTATGTGTSFSATLAAMLNADSLVLVSIGHHASEGITAGSGFTALHNDFQVPGLSVESATNTTAAAATWATSGAFGGIAIEIPGVIAPPAPRVVDFAVQRASNF